MSYRIFKNMIYRRNYQRRPIQLFSMEHQDRSIYNLAIKRKTCSPIHQKNLQTIRENGNIDCLSSNIFDGQILQKIQNVHHIRPYNLVGKKQVKSYFHKNTKKKHASKRVDSGLSNSKQSNTVRSQDTDNNLYLTKQDLLDTLGKTPQKEKDPKEFPTLEKVKLRYKKYRNIWNEPLSHPSENNKRTNIYELVDLNRKTFERREMSSLKEKKQNIPVSKWNQTLRYSFNLQRFYDHKFVQKIEKDGMCVKGVSKKNKEVQWVSNQTNLVFQFYEKEKKNQNTKNQDRDRKLDTKLKFKFNMRS